MEKSADHNFWSSRAGYRRSTQFDEPVRTGFDLVHGGVARLIQGHGEVQQAVDVNQGFAQIDFAKRAAIGCDIIGDQLIAETPRTCLAA